jgi:hypothetical protein
MDLGVKPGSGQSHRSKHAGVVVRIAAHAAEELPPTALGHPEWMKNPEGYRLNVNASGAEIAAPTAQGAFYGIQTLAQLLTRTGGAVSCPCVTVEDWPSLAFRGAHWFPSASGVPFHRKLIGRIMARYKMNFAVIQCEAARWDTDPGIAAPNSISKADLRGLVRLCRENFIEPVPLVNCPGHAEWMFRNGRHLDLAEDPQTPYAYCVDHPGSRKLIKSVIGEALEVFHPAYFHLGHDEVTLKGRFPRPDCPRCGKQSVTGLMLKNYRRLDGWLRKRKVRTIIWGDMLLEREGPPSDHAASGAEARARRAALPRGALVADWHYNARGGFPSLELLQKDGLDPIACTWYQPMNIFRFALAAKKAGARGLLQTTWAGFFPDETTLRGQEARQFSAFVLAAEYAWSGRPEPPRDLPYDPAVEFRRAYSGPSRAAAP